MRILAALIAILWAPLGWSLTCSAEDRDCAAAALEAHPVGRLDRWESALARPLRERIVRAAPDVLDYLALDNIREGVAQRPRAARPDDALASDLERALASLPRRVQHMVAGRLAAIVLMEDLGGTGYTAALRDTKGEEVAGFVVLDAGVLATRTANQWATWKENSPFRPTPGIAIEARIERPDQDTRTQALQFILLHEFGHIVSIGAHLHPPWTRPAARERRPERYAFSRISWTLDDAVPRFVPRRNSAISRRDDVVYYFGARLESAHAPQVYRGLAASSFPTLYAATNPADDFAESFANYVHVVLMGRPWEVRIRRGETTLLRLRSCWDQARCLAKRWLLESLLTAPRHTTGRIAAD